MRFTRHAKNRMRLYGTGRSEVLAIIDGPESINTDEKGNLAMIGRSPTGREITVIVAHERPLVITVYPSEG